MAQPDSARKMPKQKKKFLLVLLCVLLIPSVFVLIEVVQLGVAYASAISGLHHLQQAIKIDDQQQSSLLTAEGLSHALHEMREAHNAFQGANNQLQFNPLLSLAAPNQAQEARALSSIGVAVSDIGEQLLQMGQTLAPQLHSPILAQAKKPLLTANNYQLLRTTIENIQPAWRMILQQLPRINTHALPFTNAQQKQIEQLQHMLPILNQLTDQRQAVLDSLGWVLGIEENRTFLVQTLDRAELRPTGGFTGQFGELEVIGARMAPFSLKDIGPFEEFEGAVRVQGKMAPSPFNWWPIPNWGVRDANLSADFPTSARLILNAYASEFNKQLDGVVHISPEIIRSLITITGPIVVPEYQEIITVNNLEERLHYYQLDNEGIRKAEIVEHIPDSPDAPTIARKLFSARLARLLMEKIRATPPEKLIPYLEVFFEGIQNKDIQLYFKNPDVQALIEKFGLSSRIYNGKDHDALFLVQANVSASKASQYVTTQLHDRIQLDEQGGATHQLKMTLTYQQKGSVYGLDTYRDFVRLYLPPNAQLRNGDGFEQSEAYCGGDLPTCNGGDIYHDGSLICPPNTTDAGYSTAMHNDPYYGRPHPVHKIGEPTVLSSDEPGRQMIGGWVVIPKDCQMHVTISWYVPKQMQEQYQLLIQRQAGTQTEIEIEIVAPDQACGAEKHYRGKLEAKDLTLDYPLSSACQKQTASNSR